MTKNVCPVCGSDDTWPDIIDIGGGGMFAERKLGLWHCRHEDEP